MQNRSTCSSNCNHPMLACATQAAQAGAQILRDAFGTTVDIQSKGVANFVTQADLSAEQAIVDVIRQAYPHHAIISEESHSDRADASDLWIIDPLDGTSNFMHGIPHFAVSIAYYQNGQPQIGIVTNPITRDWYLAVRGQGAWHNDIRQQVASASQLDQTLIVCGFYYDRGKMMQATLNTLADFFHNNIHGMRRFGAAALDLCNVGCGQYGLFFEYKLHPWDYAAGQLFLSEAGGKATDCNNLALPLHKPSSICATNTLLHEQALALIRPHWNTLDSYQ